MDNQLLWEAIHTAGLAHFELPDELFIDSIQNGKLNIKLYIYNAKRFVDACFNADDETNQLNDMNPDEKSHYLSIKKEYQHKRLLEILADEIHQKESTRERHEFKNFDFINSNLSISNFKHLSIEYMYFSCLKNESSYDMVHKLKAFIKQRLDSDPLYYTLSYQIKYRHILIWCESATPKSISNENLKKSIQNSIQKHTDFGSGKLNCVKRQALADTAYDKLCFKCCKWCASNTPCMVKGCTATPAEHTFQSSIFRCSRSHGIHLCNSHGLNLLINRKGVKEANIYPLKDGRTLGNIRNPDAQGTTTRKRSRDTPDITTQMITKSLKIDPSTFDHTFFDATFLRQKLVEHLSLPTSSPDSNIQFLSSILEIPLSCFPPKLYNSSTLASTLKDTLSR